MLSWPPEDRTAAAVKIKCAYHFEASTVSWASCWVCPQQQRRQWPWPGHNFSSGNRPRGPSPDAAESLRGHYDAETRKEKGSELKF